MPIRPENKARYPKDWLAISARIRDRAGNNRERAAVGDMFPSAEREDKS